MMYLGQSSDFVQIVMDSAAMTALAIGSLSSQTAYQPIQDEIYGDLYSKRWNDNRSLVILRIKFVNDAR